MEATPIRRISMADMVCEQIQKRVKEGEWAVGERLPAESELASLFGVNRLTVRMALQKLNTLGILETRTGSGTFVVPFDFNTHIEEVSDFYTEPELLDNVHEFRSVVEMECVRLACRRRTDEELETLQTLLHAYEEPFSKYAADPVHNSWKVCVKADLAFHRQIVRMAHNRLLEYAFTVAQRPIYQYIVILNRERTMNRRDNDAYAVFENIHQTIFDGIRERDEEKCCAAYRRMIDYESEE